MAAKALLQLAARAYAASGELIDRAILPFAPTLAKERFLARSTYGFLASTGGRAYTAARHQALAGWRPGNNSPNRDTVYDLPTLRARSTDLERNDPIAGGAINTIVSNAIGTGLSLQPHIDREFLGLSDDEAEAWEDDVRRQFEVWAESDKSSADRTGNFYQKQSQVRHTAMRGGDVLALLPSIPRPGQAITLAIQLIEAERLSNPAGEPETADFCGGVQFDEWGAPLRYHVCNQYPGDLLRKESQTWKPVDAFGSSGRRNVLHIFGRWWDLRPEQARGVPLLAPVIFPLKQLKDFTEAELQSAVQAAIHSHFVEMEADAFQTVFNGDLMSGLSEADKLAYFRSLIWNGEIEGGKAVRLMPGEKVHSVQASHPNAGLDPFMLSILKRVGPALGLPVEVLVQMFAASFSASRAALNIAARQYMLYRYGDATCFCQPVYEAFLEESIALGRIRAPGFFWNDAYRAAWSGAHWIGDGFGSLNPKDDVAAGAMRVALGTSTRDAESIAHDGIPFAQKAKQLAKELKLLEKLGLPTTAPSAPGTQNTPVTMEALAAQLADLAAKVDTLMDSQ